VGLELPADIGWPHWVEDDRHQSIANVIRGIIQEHHRPAEDCKGESDVNERENEMLILLLQQLGLLLRRAQREHVVSPRERLVTRAEQWLSEKCAEPLRLADLARSLGTCPASLRSAFAAERGRSARAFLQETRLQKALSIIKSSSIKLEAIAEMAGYDSASHLTRVIKKATGQTPGALRQLSDKVVRQ
jgi:transcriptional regulator GlxA family with amidase domain